MLMRIHASLLARNKVERKSAAIAFIKSEEFKEILKDRLRACLLSPNLTAYVLELANNVFVSAYAKKNLEMFKIPVEAIEDPEMSDSISTLMKDILTSQRSNMKQKIAAGIRNMVHISVLSRSLAPGGSYEVTMAHWSRFAFLRASMVIFDTVVEECKEAQAAHKKAGLDGRQQLTLDAGNDEDETEAAARESPPNPVRIWASSEYWEFLDLLLCDVRKAARKAEATPHGREKHVQAFFTDCLQKDLRKFPAKAAQVNNPPYEKVSVQWQKAIHTELIW
ncbi:hypothetical protein BKA82DRAFT_947693 [Pisolithus tinctorius]|uniref:Uncharacterized protein n=1 Tax=Pisolithus tinctorius Marx 270 TaxID=870435 RepID=A0A0C3JA30_PISTI|nr:hypothetical protein BKA82DRAFT_947693 [Pisolithus tinctorius]KIO05873.1 hypothetical protein M404DRAFT_947693 [Pisolithus tinctorius Marx 270]